MIDAQFTPEIFLTGDILLLREVSLVLLQRNVKVFCSLSDQSQERMLPHDCILADTVPEQVSAGIELTLAAPERKRANLEFLDASLPAGIPLLSSSITITAAAQSAWVDSPDRLIGISAMPYQFERPLIELAPSLDTARDCISRTEALMIRIGKEIAIVQDRIGMVLPRVVCSLINEAFFAVMEEVAGAEEIDIAMKLGVNYPQGPIEWGNRIGLPNVVAILDAIHRDTGEERYRAAPLLRQMAAGDQWWNTGRV